MVSEVVLFY